MVYQPRIVSPSAVSLLNLQLAFNRVNESGPSDPAALGTVELLGTGTHRSGGVHLSWGSANWPRVGPGPPDSGSVPES